ncbi:MAG: hypothetical protein GXX96_13440 [Planctomycetaceae bacterium]|nr:hypothetical protein [Planctomycetaceae bacterium]
MTKHRIHNTKAGQARNPTFTNMRAPCVQAQHKDSNNLFIFLSHIFFSLFFPSRKPHPRKNVRSSVIALSAIAVLWIAPSPCRACFSIVVGKDASTDGCVLVAHNEDDSPPQVVNHHKIPRRSHAPGEVVTLRNGGTLEQVPETWAYLWSEMPGPDFSDSYLNEWGVCVTSDNCPSRENRGELTDGGIGYMLRRLVAERARTAREGVRIAGELVERFGYVASGRTYVIADPQEGWLFCVIRGKHWLAHRVADGQVAMVANTFTVRKVDLADTQNVLASHDIVTYAVGRGWYDPEKDGPFDFAAVYADPKAAANPANYGRQSNGLRYVAVNPLAVGNKPPFSVVPAKKTGVHDLIRVLRHNGGDSICTVEGQQVVCNSAEAICRGNTQTSFVTRLGTQPSRDRGLVYWMCLAAPETSVFIPFPFGIADFPPGFRAETERPSQERFDQKVTSPFPPEPPQAFWTFSNFANKVRAMPESEKARLSSRIQAVEAQAGDSLAPMTETRHAGSPATAPASLQDLPGRVYRSALEMMEQTLTSDSMP